MLLQQQCLSQLCFLHPFRASSCSLLLGRLHVFFSNMVCDIIQERAADKPLPLQHTWHVWEQIQRDAGHPDRAMDYSENTRDLASFNTVQVHPILPCCSFGAATAVLAKV